MRYLPLSFFAAATAAPLQEDGLPRGIVYDNETLLKEQLARNDELMKTGSDAESYCNLGGVFRMPVCYQICDEWCWAATSSMLIDAYKGASQCQGLECQLASAEFGGRCCPYTNSCRNSPSDRSNSCNHGGTTRNIADAVRRFGGVSVGTHNALSQAQLDSALMSKNPVLIGVMWSGGGGHALLIGGCANGRYYLHDPWGWYAGGRRDWQTLTYNQLLRYVAPNGGVGRWTFSVSAARVSGEGLELVALPNSTEVVV